MTATHDTKENVSTFYERIAAEFEDIADRVLGSGTENIEQQRELRHRALQIRAGANGLAIWLASGFPPTLQHRAK